jgi:hypothetical protein
MYRYLIIVNLHNEHGRISRFKLIESTKNKKELKISKIYDWQLFRPHQNRISLFVLNTCF